MKMNKHVISFVVLISLVVPLVVYAIMGTYSRATADDYVDMVRARDYGVFGGALNLYMTWGGRFSAHLVQTFIGQTRYQLIPYFPLIYILLLSISISLTIYRVQFSIPKRSQIYLSIMLSFTILLAFLTSMPHLRQSFYWANAAVLYTLPIVVFSFYCLATISWWRKRGENRRKLLIISYVLAFLFPVIAGGFNEVFVVMEVTLFTLILINILILTREGNRISLFRYFSISLLGSLVALALVFLSPGNAIRQQYFPLPPHLWTIILIAVKGYGALLLLHICGHPIKIISIMGLLFLSIFAGAYVLSFGERQLLSISRIKLLLFTLPIEVSILIIACYFPGAYGMSDTLPERAMSIPDFTLVIAVTIWGFLWGYLHFGKLIEGVNQRVIAAILTVSCIILCMIPLYIAQKTWQDGSPLRIYASQWDRMNSQIISAKQHGDSTITVDPLIDWAGLGSYDTRISKASNFYGITIKLR
jgi:hypothetical protein